MQHCASELQLRVDFFRKLGYSQQEVQAALQKLGLGTDTNTVLGELVRAGARASPTASQESDEVGSSVPHQGGGSTRNKENHWGSRHTAHEDVAEPDNDLKPIVIDGSNVAMSHGNKEVFSCRGIELAVNYFLERGHRNITVFVPSWRKEQPRPDVPISDQHILGELERKKIVVFTPSRRVGGKRVVCYDDRFIVRLAHEVDGIIVSNDTYRDLQSERSEWKRCIEERLLMYSFVNDKFMPPDDPLGRHGPNLDDFLRKKPLLPDPKRQLCPYGKKCTYGIKCKFHHPERINQSHRSLADELRDNARLSNPVYYCPEDGRGVGPSHRGPYHCEPGFGSYFPSLEQELEKKLTLDPKASLVRSQLNDSMLPYRDDLRCNKNHAFNPASHAPLDWQSLQCPFLTNPSSVVSSDSGLGSYESLLSETSRSHKHRGSSDYNRSSFEFQETSHTCGCSSDTARQGGPQRLSSFDQHPSSSFIDYSTVPSPRPGPVQHYSLPAYTQPDGLHPSHPSNKGWSDPRWLPQPREIYSLPDCLHTAGRHSPAEMYRNIKGMANPQTTVSFEAEREEVRKKLYAIFNPYHVNKVMDMFPKLKDAQKLAAEILKFKSRESF
ncbi:endoribonuclease ZC3H12A [Astyanax mexicanus]|uniref:Endoribonuclease ZC3H12A n=1 Tax=Astyanax mexicanus TaxID=7994 RepID=A0A8B9JP74_ASTMX|nr:endoribonuclease ZC3H12A [Astyanax mexicanus]